MTSLLNKFRKLLYFLGRRSAVWLLVGIFAGLSAGRVDLTLGFLLQALIQVLGLTGPSTSFLGSFFVDYLSEPKILMIALFFTISTKALMQYLISQSSSNSQLALVSRLRRLAVYDLLFNKKFVSASQVNTQVGELFPKASQFAQHVALAIPMALQGMIILSAMFFFPWQEALIALVLIGVIGFLLLRLNVTVRGIASQLPSQQQHLNEGIERVARNWLLIRILRTSQSEAQKLFENINQYARHAISSLRRSHAASALPIFAGGVILVAILIMNLNFFEALGVSLITFFYLLMRFTQTLATFAQHFGSANHYLPQFKLSARYFFGFSADQLDEALHHPSHMDEVSSKTIAQKEKPPAPKIEIQNLGFRYDEKEKWIFKSLNLSISSGDSIGIVGRSGSGKSTLLALILGVIEPEEGKILIDGLSPHDYFKKSGARVGYVGAEAFLIEGSIKENLSYGLGFLANDDDCWQALQKARLDDVILSKSEKLNFRLKENGEGLSAGQKQRLALARSFLAKPQILILDEASANLDEQTEKEIVESLATQEHSSTLIIVSHRPGILKRVSRMINIESSQSLKNEIDLAKNCSAAF